MTQSSDAKRLYRSTTDKKISGVCGGIAEYFGQDATLIRLGWVVGTVLTGGFLGVIGYIVAAAVIPTRPVRAGAVSAVLTVESLDSWLTAYGSAWQTMDAAAAGALFSSDALYYETPYSEPFIGQEGVSNYWAGVTIDQSDVRFTHEVIGVTDDVGVARWNAKLTSVSTGDPVELDGVFLLEFDADDRCCLLREWWHFR